MKKKVKITHIGYYFITEEAIKAGNYGEDVESFEDALEVERQVQADNRYSPEELMDTDLPISVTLEFVED